MAGPPDVKFPGLPPAPAAAAAAARADVNPAAEIFGGPIEPPPKALNPGGGIE